MVRVRLAVFCICFPAITCSASAQSGSPLFGSASPPSVGATGGMSVPVPPPTFGGGNESHRHLDFTGKPCLSVSGYARSFRINPNLYDHVITAVNSCPQRIAIQVCYYQSKDCIPMEIPGDARKDAILGTMPSEKSFRFEFREKFANQ